MIRVNLQLPMARKRVKTLTAVSKATGISRTTLSNLCTEKAAGIQFSTLDTLCSFLDCGIEDLLELVPDKKKAAVIS